MNAKQTLVVIDMQPGFEAANDEPTIEQVLVAVKEAKEANLPIFIVQCVPERYGHTLSCIMEEVDLYDNVHIIEKYCNDGAPGVEKVVNENDLQVSEHVVCGVNIGACVHDTVDTFINEYERDIIILKSACNCHHIARQTYEDYEDKEAAFKHFPLYQRPEVTLAGYPC